MVIYIDSDDEENYGEFYFFRNGNENEHPRSLKVNYNNY